VEAQLVANLLDVVLRSALRDDEPFGDLAVRETIGDELGDLPFAPAQLGTGPPSAHLVKVVLIRSKSRY
jgi:hypothetical protein